MCIPTTTLFILLWRYLSSITKILVKEDYVCGKTYGFRMQNAFFHSFIKEERKVKNEEIRVQSASLSATFLFSFLFFILTSRISANKGSRLAGVAGFEPTNVRVKV